MYKFWMYLNLIVRFKCYLYFQMQKLCIVFISYIFITIKVKPNQTDKPKLQVKFYLFVLSLLCFFYWSIFDRLIILQLIKLYYLYYLYFFFLVNLKRCCHYLIVIPIIIQLNLDTYLTFFCLFLVRSNVLVIRIFKVVSMIKGIAVISNP